MNKAICSCLLVTVLLTTVSLADAQQPTKIPRIGYLSGTSYSANSARVDAFKQGLRELGYVSYATSFTDLSRRAATYVDRILNGAKPAELPVEQPTKFGLIINLKTAKQIGLTIPPGVLARADKIIR